MFTSLLAAAVFATLCPPPAPEGCLVPPVVVEAEVWSEEPAGPGEVVWGVDGAVVASDRLHTVGNDPKRVALILEPARLQHWIGVEVRRGPSVTRVEAGLPPVCPFLLQLASFRWGSQGVWVRLTNRGPWGSGRVPLRWFINGVRYSEGYLDPLPAGEGAELTLPASATPLLRQALTAPTAPRRRNTRSAPVVVALEVRPGVGDLEAPRKTWSFFLGFGR